MAPKGKKASAKKPTCTGAAAANKNWESGLITAPFEEESWRVCVSLVVGRSPDEEEELTRDLALAAQRPMRRLFHLLTHDGALAQIRVQENPKAKKPDEPPPFHEVTEAAMALLDAGQEIPCDLMAKVLKFQMLQIKAGDQQRREAEQAAAAAPLPASKDKAAAKVSGKKGKNLPSPVEEKKTKLKRRDDVEPPKFIDDEPEDGPQCYILLLGFYQPHLIGALDAVGVHVASVISLCSQTSAGTQEEQNTDAEDDGILATQTRKLALFWSGLRPVLDSGPLESRLHDVVQLSCTLPQLLSPCDAPGPEAELGTGSRIFDGVASLIYVYLEQRRQHRHYLDSMKLISIPTVVRLEPQDVQTPAPASPRSRRKSGWEEIPPEREFERPPLSTDVDMRYYGNLLDRVPPEACSVPLILHCMLEQVVFSAQQPPPTAEETEEATPDPGPWLDQQLVSFMLQSFLPLARSEEERSDMLNSLVSAVQSEKQMTKLVESFGAEDTQKKSEEPLVIRHHDERALRLRDVNANQGFDPAEVERSMTRLSPVWELIHSGAQRRTSASCWDAVKQQLQHRCSDDAVSWLEVERLFHRSVFESMPLTRVNQEGVLVNDPLGRLEADEAIPWDDPQCYAQQQLKNLQNKGPTFLTEDPGNTEIREGVCSQLDLSDIQRLRLRSLFDRHFSEHHDASVLPQVLQSASEEYRCLDTFRGSHDNILYIFCHNPMSPQRQCKEFWDVSLHTDVKFRKYLEHVADTISDWTKEEEVKREAERLSLAESPKDGKVPESEEEEEGTLEPVIRKDSLKAWKLEQEQLKEQETAKESKKGKKPERQKEVKAKEVKKATDKKSRAGTEGSLAESIVNTAPPVVDKAELQPTEEPFKAFIGYSTGGSLVHVSGRLQYLFPSDGGRVTVENISFAEGSSLMKVAVDKDGHHFCTHVDRVVVVDRAPRDKGAVTVSESGVRRVRQGSFTAVLDSGVRLSYSFYGPTGLQATDGVAQETSTLVPVPRSSSIHHSEETGPDSVPSETNGHARTPEFQVCEDRLNVSVPNGLLLQFQREDTQAGSSPEHGVSVRQSFPRHGTGTAGQPQDLSLTQEQSRTVTDTGAVIRHMRDGSTEVLFADGSVIFSPDSGPVWVPDSEVEEENGSETASQRGHWLTTTPCGTRIHTVGSTHRSVPATPLLAFKATDPFTHEVMLTREDLVVSVQHADGSLTVEHKDGTRISSLLRDRAANTPEAGCDGADIRDAKEGTSSDGSQSDEGVVAPKERVVLVEKEGCATVVMYPERRVAHVSLADGTVITGDGRGPYEVFPSRGGFLQIHNNGTCVYSSDPPATPRPTGGAPANPPGSYTMSHTDQVACDVTDLDGNHFRVMDDGQSSVFSPAPAGLDQNDSPAPVDLDQNDSPAPARLDQNDSPAPAELDQNDSRASAGLDQNDSTAPAGLDQNEEEEEAQMKLQDHCPRLFLVHEDGSGTELLSSRTAEEVVCQACSDPTVALLNEPLLDAQDEFGIIILKPSHQSAWSQWLLEKQNPNITPPNLRNRSWRDFPQTRAQVPSGPTPLCAGRGLTPRERSAGSPAQCQPVRSCPKVLEIRELNQHRPVSTLLRDTVDMRLKEHIEGVMARERWSEEVKVKDPRTEEENVRASNLLNLVLSLAEEEGVISCFDRRTSEDVFSLYNQQVGDPADQSDVSEDTSPSDSFTSVKESNWTERLERLRQEIREEQFQRGALRNNHVVPFFHPENAPLFQNLPLRQTPDLRSLSVDLPPIAPSGSSEALLKDANQQNTPRPSNPTPSQSASHEAGSDSKLERRPTNPTPQTAGDGALRASGQRQSVQVDVSGEPRGTKVRPPACRVLNQQFPSAQDPVRRKRRSQAFQTGFQLLPPNVDFGTLQEGTTSSIAIRMKNVGVDTCSFQLKQPPPATGLRVLYSPGPVDPGLHVELQVQLFAISTVQAGEEERVFQDIIIHTEMDVLHLPVTATIVPQSFKDHTLERRSSRVRQLSSSPPGGRRGHKARQTKH